MIAPDTVHPTVAVSAPAIPAACTPTKVEAFTASGPGVICEIVIISANTRAVIQPRRSTISCWIMGITA